MVATFRYLFTRKYPPLTYDPLELSEGKFKLVDKGVLNKVDFFHSDREMSYWLLYHLNRTRALVVVEEMNLSLKSATFHAYVIRFSENMGWTLVEPGEEEQSLNFRHELFFGEFVLSL